MTMGASRVLIVEDDQSIAELQKDYLEINGFEVVIASTGKVGLKEALSQTYDMIILDLMLPEIDGFEILKKIRETMEIPVMLVTARLEDIDKIRGLGLGADDYMTKPFSPNELVARVKAHLLRYERLLGQNKSKQREIAIRGLSISLDSRRVFMNNLEVTLTTKEFELLLFLAQNPDRVFSKEYLFEKLWGYDNYGDISTVTVHIGKIREKIEVDSSNPQYIETIWGAGYRFKI
jgi:DNA-binding response OmpR family regulator